MPEGHTIHRLASDHQKMFAGQKLRVSSPQGRFEDGAARIDGQKLTSVEACGKHLFYRWDSQTLHIHLGLYGKFRKHKLPLPEPRGQVRLRVVGQEAAFDLNGPTACELLTKDEVESIFHRLGPDPLRSDSSVEEAVRRIRKSRRAIGKLLMDQSVIAGIGNIYRAEILHLLCIHPDTPGNALPEEQVVQIWDLAKELLKIGKRYNRIIIADPEQVGKPRSRMNRNERLLIYKKPTCYRCDASVEHWKMDGRTVYACPVCQEQPAC